ncbi:hypothetical protein TrST_g493 [Triparma strigata]|uniref:Cystathionine beta-synthase n=1 Tax=Triparma strigata TaxID=1606541 RepID=A0A9W7ELR7_9STRA|nr:hypothetical protein TrST_g493 [Triparma strigata]
MPTSDMSVTSSDFLSALPSIVSAIPKDWYGTTFANLALKSRKPWSEELLKLIQEKKNGITKEDLDALGNAEDYWRVSSNISCLLECYYAVLYSTTISNIFTFTSSRMPAIAAARCGEVCLVGSSPLFTKEHMEIIETLNLKITQTTTLPPSTSPNTIYVNYIPEGTAESPPPLSGDGYDATVFAGILVIHNDDKIPPADVLVTRKRMSCPFTTPLCSSILTSLSGGQPAPVVASDPTEFLTHLQKMSGSTCPIPPRTFGAGLPALCSMWSSMLTLGSVDVLMASTAYGGSSQLTDLMTLQNPNFNKYTFDIQGEADFVESVSLTLDKLKESGTGEYVVIMTEIPTNPDMKVPSLKKFITLLNSYKSSTSKNVILLVDTTFAPASSVISKVQSIDPDFTCMAFVSMSKSVSRGLTCAGGIVGSHTDLSSKVMQAVVKVSDALDSAATVYQVNTLVENHTGVEQRNRDAYNLAKEVGEVLCSQVKKSTGVDMPLAFVTAANASDGFTTSTFSFNLPPPPNASDEDKAGLAQKFVDVLQLDTELFKPCVSFGQDNRKCYATVPATSTQGAIKEEDKIKQAKGGVQLTRLSFPVSMDERVKDVVREAVGRLYEEMPGSV